MDYLSQLTDLSFMIKQQQKFNIRFSFDFDCIAMLQII